MALVTTLYGPDSNSYVTLAEIEANLFGTALTTWQGLRSAAEKEAYARKATSIIDMQIYSGEPYNDTTQALSFPRTSTYTEDDEGVITYVIPSAVKNAQYAQVSALLTEGFSDPIMQYRAKGVTQLGLGPGNTISMKGLKPSSKDFLCAEARILLSPFFAHPTIRIERG